MVQALNRKYILYFVLGTAIALFLILAFIHPGHPSLRFQDRFPSLFKEKEKVPWLIATMSAAWSQQRRNIIRATWQHTYRSSGHFDTVFVIAKTKDHDLWEPLIRQENATWGDLILLDHIEENRDIANTIKPIEFYKHLVHKHEAEGGEPWKFVSKVDDDSYLDATTFYNEFLLPRLDCKDTIIARYLSWAAMTGDKVDYPCPGGQFYTMSWDIVETLARLHTENPIQGLMEDGMLGKLLYEGKHPWELVRLNDSRAFDINEDTFHGQGMPPERPDLGPVDAMTMAVNPHKMKKDESYLKVAALFDEHGFKNKNSSG